MSRFTRFITANILPFSQFSKFFAKNEKECECECDAQLFHLEQAAIIVRYTDGVISWREPGRGRQLCRRYARCLCSGVWSIDICPVR